MDSTYPFMAPTKVEISTAGTVIFTEFQKYPPTMSQAFNQPMPVNTSGRLSRLPVRISSGVLKLVSSITTSGTRYTAAARIKVA